MFDDENQNEQDNLKSEFEEWYEANNFYFSPESGLRFGSTMDLYFFYTGVYKPSLLELKPLVRKLMIKQYPDFEFEFRPLVLEHIDYVVAMSGHRFFMSIFELIQDEKKQTNLHDKYYDFEMYLNDYARPDSAPEPDYFFFKKHPVLGLNLTDDERKEIINLKFVDRLNRFHSSEKLKKDYYDIIQTIIFKNYPIVLDLDYDGWIIYSALIREEYDDYKYRCEHIATFIKYGLQEEDINLKSDEIQRKISLKQREGSENKHSSSDSEM